MLDRIATPELAKETGFTAAAYLDPAKLELLPDVRGMCADNRCGQYGKCWSCPPACGTLEELGAKLRGYNYGLLLQVTGQMEDSFDIDAMEKAERDCNDALERLAQLLRGRCRQVLPLRAGVCQRCKTCTYPDAPCRFPEFLSPSLEACGLFVSRECERCGLPYYYGPNTITFVAAVLVSDS